MKIKDGVCTSATVVRNGIETNIHPSDEIKAAWTIADEISQKVSKKECVVTSILDGKHKKGSKHYTGNAFDMRTYIYTVPEIKEIIQRLKDELGRNYDVVLEGNHIHVEYDPK